MFQNISSNRVRSRRLLPRLVFQLALCLSAWSCPGLTHAGTDSVSDPKSIPPSTLLKNIASWSPGDPMSFGNGVGTFDIQVRERFEARNNWIDFNSATNVRDDTGLLQRLRLGLKLVPTKDVTIYAQMEDSRTFFSDTSSLFPNLPGSQSNFVTNDDPIALRQAYFKFDNIAGQPVGFTLGRQVLAYGDERLVGGFDWDNNARVFDAVKLSYKQDNYTVDTFAAYPVPHQTEDFDVPYTNDLFLGSYATTTFVPNMTSDYYVFWRSKSELSPTTSFTTNENQSEGDTAPNGDYATLGTRWKSLPGKWSNWDFGYEGAFQVGSITNPLQGTATTVSGQTINTARQNLLAGMSHAEVGYTFKTDWTPRPFACFDFGSGSNNPDSGTSNTFQNLYPTNHPLYGIMDRFSLQNMYQITFGVIAKPTDKLTLRVDYHNTWLVSTADEWRIANQTPLGSSAVSPAGKPPASGYPGRYTKALAANPNSYVGSEVNLIATYAVTKWCQVQAGGAIFFAGPYVRQTAATGQTNNATFGYTQVKFDF